MQTRGMGSWATKSSESLSEFHERASAVTQNDKPLELTWFELFWNSILGFDFEKYLKNYFKCQLKTF